MNFILPPIIQSILKRVQVLSPFFGIICIWLLVATCNENRLLKHKNQSNTARVTTATKIIERYVDSGGSEHLVVQDNAFTKEQVQNILKTDKYVKDTLARALKIATDRINELTRINATLVIASKGTVVTPGDKNSIVTGKDKWLNWSYNPTDTMLNMNYNVQLDHVKYNPDRKILGIPFGKNKSVSYLDLFSPDPRIKLNSVERLTIADKQPDFGFKAESKLYLNLLGDKNLLPGGGVELRYKKFTVGADWLYDGQRKDDIVIGVVKYNLFEL